VQPRFASPQTRRIHRRQANADVVPTKGGRG
jgi:hypothetical protein